ECLRRFVPNFICAQMVSNWPDNNFLCPFFSSRVQNETTTSGRCWTTEATNRSNPVPAQYPMPARLWSFVEMIWQRQQTKSKPSPRLRSLLRSWTLNHLRNAKRKSNPSPKRKGVRERDGQNARRASDALPSEYRQTQHERQ